MALLGTTLRPTAAHVMLLGSDELGREVAIECQCLGVEVIAVDRYADAPTIHIARRSRVINMLDGDTLRRVVGLEKPHYIASEIKAIATDMLIQLGEGGLDVVPCAHAAELTMNREGIRHLATEELQLPTPTYCLADSKNLFREAVAAIGYPYIVKPMISSSGKGQTFIHSAERLTHAWEYARQGGCAGANRAVVEGVVKFDFEIALLTVDAADGAHFCALVSHRQEDGNYRESWRPQRMNPLALERAQEIARKVVLALGGYGLFGVELLVYGDEMIFNEVSPRPRDTGMAALISQDLSEFALHIRAFLGLPIDGIHQYGPAASAVVLPQLTSQNVTFDNVQNVVGADLQIRLSGKLGTDGSHRLRVTLAIARSVVDAIERAEHTAEQVKVQG